MGIIVSFSLYFNLTALSAVIFVMPILILIYFIKNLKKLQNIFSLTINSMRTNIDDIVIISLAMMIGFIITNSPNQNFLYGYFDFELVPNFLIFILIPLTMCILSILCIHPVISSTI